MPTHQWRSENTHNLEGALLTHGSGGVPLPLPVAACVALILLCISSHSFFCSFSRLKVFPRRAFSASAASFSLCGGRERRVEHDVATNQPKRRSTTPTPCEEDGGRANAKGRNGAGDNTQGDFFFNLQSRERQATIINTASANSYIPRPHTHDSNINLWEFDLSLISDSVSCSVCNSSIGSKYGNVLVALGYFSSLQT